jgi:L-asparaginase II
MGDALGGAGTLGAIDVSRYVVPIAVTTRSGHPESLHHGAVVAIAADGRVEWSAGDPWWPIYPRSSNKPMQAVAMLRAGLRVGPSQLAVVCASHDGTPDHLAAARSILTDVGLDERALRNTADLPLDDDAAEEVVRHGGARTPLQMNCSGKHAGMIATCIANGWDVDSYLDVEHPLQRSITAVVGEACGEAASHIGVDGCGAPAHVVSLVGLARGFAAVATGSLGAESRAVHAAMTTHPLMVGGRTRDVTLLMQGIDGLIAKDGAEGVYAAALPDGRAIALKVADGASRARAPVMLAALARLGVDVASVDAAATSSIMGHGRPVGTVRSLV